MIEDELLSNFLRFAFPKLDTFQKLGSFIVEIINVPYFGRASAEIENETPAKNVLAIAGMEKRL